MKDKAKYKWSKSFRDLSAYVLTLAWTFLTLRLFAFLALATGILVLAGGVGIHLIEPKTFGSWSDSFWWSVVTITTLGAGDAVPQSLLGRIWGTGIVLSGFFLLSVMTATIVSLAVLGETAEIETEIEEEEEALKTQLDRIEKKLDRLLGLDKGEDQSSS